VKPASVSYGNKRVSKSCPALPGPGGDRESSVHRVDVLGKLIHEYRRAGLSSRALPLNLSPYVVPWPP
jgi:hypothetical protein